MELFAQQQGGGGGAGAGAAILGMLAVYAVILVIALAVQIMFLLSMSKCLKQVSRRNRQMEPGQVWLCLIPIFGFVWTIIMILRVADSLKDEYYDRGIRGDGDFGKTLGLVYIVSAFICGPVAIVCWIMYWVKIAGYTKTLMSDDFDDDGDDREEDEDDRRGKSKGRGRRDEDEDEDDDDRPRRRR